MVMPKICGYNCCCGSLNQIQHLFVVDKIDNVFVVDSDDRVDGDLMRNGDAGYNCCDGCTCLTQLFVVRSYPNLMVVRWWSLMIVLGLVAYQMVAQIGCNEFDVMGMTVPHLPMHINCTAVLAQPVQKKKKRTTDDDNADDWGGDGCANQEKSLKIAFEACDDQPNSQFGRFWCQCLVGWNENDLDNHQQNMVGSLS